MAGPYDEGYNPGDSGYRGSKKAGKTRPKVKKPKSNNGRKVGPMVDRPAGGRKVGPRVMDSPSASTPKTTPGRKVGPARNSPVGPSPAGNFTTPGERFNPVGPGRPGFGSNGAATPKTPLVKGPKTRPGGGPVKRTRSRTTPLRR